MTYRTIALLALLSLTATGCVTSGSAAKTENASMEWRMKSLEESFLDFRERQKTQDEEQAAFRERMERRMDDLEKRLAHLGDSETGTVATPSEDNSGNKEWVTDLKPEEEEGWTEVQPEAEKNQAAKPKETDGKSVAESREPKPWSKVPGPEVKAATPQELYDLALKDYQEGKFIASRKLFDQFLAKYPKNELAANSLYWKGETYYSEKNYAQAILTFKEVALKFPKHRKVPDAMLKTGMAYELAGDRDNALFYLQTLVQDYPKSTAAAKGRERLRAMGA